jgi:cyclase
MRHAFSVFCLAVLVATLCPAQTTTGTPRIVTTQVTPNFYIIAAPDDDADVAIYLGNDGLLLIDTGLAPLVPSLRDAIRKITDKPVKYTVLTHYHFDHIGGADALANGGPIIATARTRGRMTQSSHIGGRNDPPAPAAALPTVTFEKEMSLWMDGEEIRLIAQPAHTDGDAVLWFTRSNVVHLGDAMWNPDNEGGGDIHGVIALCEKVAALVPPDAKIIVGHLGVLSVDDLRKQTAQWKDITGIIEKAIRQGKSLEQIKQEKLLAGHVRSNPEGVAENIYQNLKHEAKP